MGFTSQMGEILAAGDVLVHSSAGLTVLESLIRGCPVISYGFGYGHVRESNRAFERFGLARVARNREELGPALRQALLERPEPDGSFAVRSSTASLILSSGRRVVPVPSWRLRAVRGVTALSATVLVAGCAATTSFAYSFISEFASTDATTQVPTARPEIGLMIDTSSQQEPMLAQELSGSGIHFSFAVYKPNPTSVLDAMVHHDEIIPRLPDGGVVSWIHTRSELGRLIHTMFGRHFLYASSGPSLAQWLLAHGDGGRLVAGAVRLSDHGPWPHRLHIHKGEIVELQVKNAADARVLLQRLERVLRHDGLEHAVPVTRLLESSGVQI
jgi:hypothetical protein